VNIELQLLATMLKAGDFTPLQRGDITEAHFQTDAGKALYNFITTYRYSTGGEADYPSLSVVRKRFKKSAIELPEPDPGDTVEALAYETRLEKLKADIREAATEMAGIAQDSPDPIGDMEPILGRLRTATERNKRSNHTSLATGILGIVDDYSMGAILPSGIPWPWPSLTKATKGMQQKEVVIFCGRPKSRKTFTALHCIIHAAKLGHRALIFSPEMPPRQALLRVIADFCSLPYREFKDGKMNDAEEMRLFEAAAALGQIEDEDDDHYELRLTGVAKMFPELFPGGRIPKIDIIQSTGRDTTWLKSQIQMYRPDVVLFDSFYRQHASGGKKYDNNGDWKAITSVSRDIKDMTMDTAVRTLVTHQLNRGAEKTVGDLSNMALADAVGQDADMIARVVTGKMNSKDVSAIVFLGAREIAFDGLLINNVPSRDFSEIGEITNRKQVEALMQQEDEAEAEEEKKAAAAAKAKGPVSAAARQAALRRGGSFGEGLKQIEAHADVHEAQEAPYAEEDV
jgi:hypothetical protein